MTNIRLENRKDERGAALITVLFITLLLLTASAAMLTAVGANSKNTTDVLAETKAYYAAESGLQATLTVLRGNTDLTPADVTDDIDYIKATALATSNYAGDPSANARLSAWLTYNYPTTGTPDRVVIGQAAGSYNPNSGAAYKVVVSDPDAGPFTYSTSGKFLNAPGGTLSVDRKTISIPDAVTDPRTEISFTDIAAPPTTPNTLLGTFTVTKTGGGSPITSRIDLRIDYRLLTPRNGIVSIFAHIAPQAAATDPVIITFDSAGYSLLGSTIRLCSAQNTASPCPSPLTLSLSGNTSASFYGYVTPPSPYRLLITSTGYGPNGAVKKLEAIVRGNLFDGYSAPAVTVMLGPNVAAPGETYSFLYSPGSSSPIVYSGGDCANRCVPTFGVNNQANLDYIIAHPPAGGYSDPLPSLLDSTNLPTWLQSPAALDSIIDRLRTTAQHSNRYFVSPTGNITDPGSFVNGTGITFCEGNCRVNGNGGGVLIVTGKLTNLGGFSFKGMIIITGEEGWDRTGGSNGQITGNIVIAPYNRRTYVPENLSSAFLAPRYEISGGGVSGVTGSDVNPGLDDTSAISDLMAGVAEK